MKMKMKAVKIMGLAILFGASLSACKEESKSNGISYSVNGSVITGDELIAHYGLKNINAEDMKSQENEKAKFFEREGLTQLMLETDVLSASEVSAELAQFKQQMVISRYFDKYLKEQVTEEAIKNYYTANPEQFETEQVHVAHILFRFRPNMSEEERNVVRTKAHEVYSRLQAGENFTTLAQEFSEDHVSKAKGGDLNWIKKGSIDQNFSNKAFTMQADEVSEPIGSTYGFHLIKLIDGPKVVKHAFEKVQGDIRYQLRNQAKQAEMARLTALVVIK